MSLSNIKVLDLTRVLAGPYCTQLLADLGATVTKLEPPLGDGTRKWGPPFLPGGMSTYFASVNRNKSSIAVDLKNPLSKPILEKLVAGADVLVHNFLPRQAAALGVDYDSVSLLNPRIVHAGITGYGDTGPLKDKPGYDVLCSAMYGLMDVTGPEGEDCGYKSGVATTDVMAGMVAAQAITAKLYERDANVGRDANVDTHVVPFDGQISTSLMETQLSMLSNVASSTLNSRVPRQPRFGNAHESIAPYQTFSCEDRKSIVVACGSDRHYRELAGILGRSSLRNPDFDTNAKRVENRDVLIPLLEGIFKHKPRDEWIDIFERNDVSFPNGPVRSVAEAFRCPQADHRSSVVEITGKEGGTLRAVAHPAKHSGVVSSEKFTHPPDLGEHTRDILLEEMGFDEEFVETMIKEKVVF